MRNTEVLIKISAKEPQFYTNIARQKLAYAGHVLTGRSSGIDTVLMLKSKINGVRTRGRLRIFGLLNAKKYSELNERSAEDRKC